MWHAICINCPECGNRTTITEVSVASDATMKLSLYCQTCEKELWWTTTFVRMTQCALALDQQPADYNEYDVRFMQAVHFKMDDQKLLGGAQ